MSRPTHSKRRNRSLGAVTVEMAISAGMFFAVCGLSVIHAAILQASILSVVAAPEGTVLHPAISWDVKGMTNVWLHYDVPVFTFVLGGLALLFAEAFRVGAAYRTDSESMV